MVEMNEKILNGESYNGDYKKLTADILNAIGYSSPAEIKKLGPAKKAKLVNLVAVYDCETSNYVSQDGEKLPFVISEAMTFLNLENNKNINVLFRHVDPFINFLNILPDVLGCYVSQQPLVNEKTGLPVTDVFGHVMYNTKSDVYLPVYVHNLPFDASFILPRLDVFQLFASAPHKPYYFITSKGLKFTDTAVLTNNSLAGLGKKLTRFNVKKRVGDFNYDEIRTPDTPFSKKELGYVLNDVLVLSAYVAEFSQDNYHANLSLLPLTQTGIVRGFLKKASTGDWSTYLELYRDHIITRPLIIKAITDELSSSIGFVKQFKKFHASMTINQMALYLFKCFTDHKFYDSCKANANTLSGSLERLGGCRVPDYDYQAFKMMKKAYQGGFTHSSAKHTDHLLQNVHSFDFTSSYPTRILSQLFASSQPVKLTPNELHHLPDLMASAVDENKLLKKLYIFTVKADSLTLKPGAPDAYLSDYHVTSDDSTCTNGRVIQAEHVEFTTTSIDWEIVSQLYSFTGLTFTAGYKFNQSYLPRFLTASTIYFYSNKTKLKHVKGREADYMRSKQMLNSCYGCMVSDITRPDVYYDNADGWFKNDYYDAGDDDLAEKVFEKQKSAFLYYVWGVEVSAYARVALWRGILGVKGDYVYSDTDSLKVLNWRDHLDLINNENGLITKQIKLCLTSAGINPDLASPKDIKGITHPLGVWDPDDGDYKYFKTLGAKRYIDVDDSGCFEITIAGLSKKSGASYIVKASKAKYKTTKAGLVVDLDYKNINKLFLFFNNGMYVPASATGKLASYYVDQYPAFTYNGVKIPAGGGCLLSPVDFTMSMAVSFETILKMFMDGYNFGDKFNL